MAIPKLYTIEEVAEMLHVTRWAVQQYVRSGKLRPVRPGNCQKRVLFTENDIRDFLGLERTAD